MVLTANIATSRHTGDWPFTVRHWTKLPDDAHRLHSGSVSFRRNTSIAGLESQNFARTRGLVFGAGPMPPLHNFRCGPKLGGKSVETTAPARVS